MTSTRAATSTTCPAPSPARTRTWAIHYFNITAQSAPASAPTACRPARPGCAPCRQRAPQANNYLDRAEGLQPGDLSRARVSPRLYQINDDWNVLITESLQDLDAEGLSVEYPDGLRLPDAAAAAGHLLHAVLQQGPLFETPPGPSTARSAISRPSTPAATPTATSTSRWTTPTTPAPAAACITSASAARPAGAPARRELLFAARLLAGHDPQHPSQQRSRASARRTTGACAPSAAPIGKSSASTTT